MSTAIDNLIYIAYEYSEQFSFFNQKKEAELLAKLNLITDESVIPLLFPLVFSQNTRLAKGIAKIIHELLSKLPIDKLPSLDYKIRKNCRGYKSSKSITAQTIKNLKLEQLIANSMYVLLCSAPDGYVREEAITSLSLNNYLNLNVAALLIRVNDWVENIQILVKKKLLQIIEDGKIDDFLPSLGLIANLYKKERHNHYALINAIEISLVERSYDKLLGNITNIKARRIAFKIAAKDTAKLPQFIAAAKQTNDIIIKLQALDIINQNLAQDALFETLRNWLTDSSCIIRIKCLRSLYEQFPKESHSIFLDTLFDKSISLREFARFYLRREDNVDIAEFYREALIHRTKPLHITIMGLAEVGRKEDFTFIEPYINDTSFKVRSACLYAIFKLNPGNKQEMLMAQLFSNQLISSKMLYLGLAKNSEGFDVTAIENAIRAKEDQFSKFLIIKINLAIIKDRWHLINYILDEILLAQDESAKALLENYASKWIIQTSPNKVFTRTNKNYLLEIQAKIYKLISQDGHKKLYFALKTNIKYFLERQ